MSSHGYKDVHTSSAGGWSNSMCWHPCKVKMPRPPASNYLYVGVRAHTCYLNHRVLESCRHDDMLRKVGKGRVSTPAMPDVLEQLAYTRSGSGMMAVLLTTSTWYGALLARSITNCAVGATSFTAVTVMFQ